MGLTHQTTADAAQDDTLVIQRQSSLDRVIALAGNPNVGKSTVFNALTGMNQHTGNWPGKTVSNAQGRYIHKENPYILVDIPGTYSLMASSPEEEVARDFICFGEPDAVVVVADATCLERNLNLALQILEVTKQVVFCVNLMDEAKKKKIQIDLDELSLYLGVPVVGTSARAGKGLEELKDAVELVAHQKKKTYFSRLRYATSIEEAISSLLPRVSALTTERLPARWVAMKLLDLDQTLHKALTEYLGIDLLLDAEISTILSKIKPNLPGELRDEIVSALVAYSSEIYNHCVFLGNTAYHNRDRKLDRILTSKGTGIPVMLLLFGAVFWLTIAGANYPSEWLSSGFNWLEGQITALFTAWNAPDWLYGALVLGLYRTLAWVVSVMLPPMAIFFPLFTLLEDSGYLPRIAFNLDRCFKKACTHGKQALTMCMGFGCNACGVIGARIIDSPRERLIAIITNSFVPCNGRFPTMIAIITMFFAGVSLAFQSVVSTALLLAVIVFGVGMTLLMSRFLSKTFLKGMPSSFALELPPYRRPQIGKVLIRSVLDRTLFVLGRAAAVAAPAGLIIWVMANVMIGDMSILAYCAAFLDPFAKMLGLDGILLMAFILGFPANEIVLPIAIMAYLCTGSMVEFTDLTSLHALLVEHGWTSITAVCTMLFSLMHFPCATTCLTIAKETKSAKWTVLSFFLPLVVGMAACFLVAQVGRLCGIA